MLNIDFVNNTKEVLGVIKESEENFERVYGKYNI